MKEAKKDGFMVLKEARRLRVSYNYHGQRVEYAKVDLAVVNNPYTGQLDIAVKPYFTDDFGAYVPLYSFEEDIKYKQFCDIATQCRLNGKPIPQDIDEYVRKMMKLKEMARKQVYAYVKTKLSGPCDDASTEYTRYEWREDIVNSPEAQALLKEYKNGN